MTAGDEVEVLDGPYRGCPGRLIESPWLDADGHRRVRVDLGLVTPFTFRTAQLLVTSAAAMGPAAQGGLFS